MLPAPKGSQASGMGEAERAGAAKEEVGKWKLGCSEWEAGENDRLEQFPKGASVSELFGGFSFVLFS